MHNSPRMQANQIQICPRCLGTRTEPDIPCRRPIPCPRCNGRGTLPADTRAQPYQPSADQSTSYAMLAAILARIIGNHARTSYHPT